jgi:hypothetical protein
MAELEAATMRGPAGSYARQVVETLKRVDEQPSGMLSYRGREGCESMECTRMPDGKGGTICVGYHCPRCDGPCSSQGFCMRCPEDA